MELYGEPIEEWKKNEWWPKGTASLRPGWTGHDHEIMVNVEGADNIHSFWVEALVALLPETWKLENRGTRVEVHPTGRLFNGFKEEDVQTLELALRELGHEVEVIR